MYLKTQLMQDTEHKTTYGVQNPLPVSIVVVVYVLYCIQIPITSVPWEEKRGKVSSNSILGFFILFCFLFLTKPCYNMTLEGLWDMSRFVKLINGSLW